MRVSLTRGLYELPGIQQWEKIDDAVCMVRTELPSRGCESTLFLYIFFFMSGYRHRYDQRLCY